MKVLLTADLHLRPTSPINRKDDYVEAQFRKLRFMLNKKLPIFVAGDFFDKATVPFWFFNRVCSLLRASYYSDSLIAIIPGNHDLIGHNINNIDQGSLWGLDLVDRVDVLMEPDSILLGTTVFHCCPFGETPTQPNPRLKNVLLIHEPVFDKEVPFYMEGKASTVEQIKEKYPGYDLIVSGDIHQSVNRDGVLVPGSMMRSTIAQKQHRPCFYELDTETMEITTHEFPIEEDVWKDFTEAVEDESYRAELKGLKEAMEGRDDRLDYPKVCHRLAEDNPKAGQRIQSLIDQYEEQK